MTDTADHLLRKEGIDAMAGAENSESCWKSQRLVAGAALFGDNPSMEILQISASIAEQIGHRPYDVKLASSIELAEGEGEAHAYVLYFQPGGVIGPHEAGFGQILVAIAGSGWVAGANDERVALAEGEAAFIKRGEVHSKGSERGMTAFMVQVRDLTPLAGQEPTAGR